VDEILMPPGVTPAADPSSEQRTSAVDALRSRRSSSATKPSVLPRGLPRVRPASARLTPRGGRGDEAPPAGCRPGGNSPPRSDRPAGRSPRTGARDRRHRSPAP